MAIFLYPSIVFFASPLRVRVAAVQASNNIRAGEAVQAVRRNEDHRRLEELLSVAHERNVKRDSEPGRIVEQLLNGLRGFSRKKGVFSLAECIQLDAQGKQVFLPTGVEPLDHVIGGVGVGDMVVIGGATASGKSLLCQQIALNVAQKGKRVMYLGLEMMPANYGARWRKQLAGASPDALPLTLIRDCGTVNALRARIAKEDDPPALVVIDYLGLMRADGINAYERTTRVSFELAEVAREFETGILSAAQLNRDTGREDRPPELYDLRDSGSIEQDASAVVLIHSPQKKGKDADIVQRAEKRGKTVKVLRVRKNRHFPVLRDVVCLLDGQSLRFEDASWLLFNT